MWSEEKNDYPDILQPIPFEEWPLVQNHFRANWPTYSNYYYWIENSIKWKEVSPELEIQIYSIRGDYHRDGTFIGISSFSITSIWVFTTEASGKIFTISEALLKSKHFDWSREIIFCGVHEHVVPLLSMALDHLKTVGGIEIASIITTRFHFKSANDATRVEVRYVRIGFTWSAFSCV
ncbi:uncharacterized protein LOC105690099 [Athalia rosae]|uniref:uncharacterized protein LOC105690099 n=1 Tax=Athalia rosae TaxID=37344 RepID=UPI00203377F7|nr:uncharacterized protein LOC105690099 [Athalia rosae]